MLFFRKWLEGNVIDLPLNLAGDLPYPGGTRYPKKDKDTGPGRSPDAGHTNAMGDFHAPGSDELPPLHQIKKMKKRR